MEMIRHFLILTVKTFSVLLNWFYTS